MKMLRWQDVLIHLKMQARALKMKMKMQDAIFGAAGQ